MRTMTKTVLALLAMAGFALTAVALENPSRMYGKVVSVDTAGGKVVIAPKDGAQVTVTTDAGTKVQVSGKDAALGNIQPGMILRVAPASGTAADLRAFPDQTGTTQPPKLSLLYGTVISVDTAGGKVVIAPKDGAQVTVATDASTKVQVNGKDATLDDIQPGLTLRVSPATGTAADLRAFPAHTAK